MPHHVPTNLRLTASASTRGAEANQRPSCFEFHCSSIPTQDPRNSAPTHCPQSRSRSGGSPPQPWLWGSDIESPSLDRIELHVPDEKQAFVLVLRWLGIYGTAPAPPQAASAGLQRRPCFAAQRSLQLQHRNQASLVPIAVLRYCARLEHLDNLERGERRAETAGHPTRALALAPALAAGRRIDERIASCQSR